MDSTNTLLAIYLGWQDYNCNAVQSSNVQSQFAWFLPRSQQFPNKKVLGPFGEEANFPEASGHYFLFFVASHQTTGPLWAKSNEQLPNKANCGTK